ncbi:unnamed protein product [Peniophora sp. CBMAI 1063]|nr:unnamed protein product [Peniophora sp. CBMAI 1063]
MESLEQPIARPSTNFYDLPAELVEQILLELDPLHVGAFAQTCKHFHALIYEAPDSHLWRHLYLQQDLDDPRRCLSTLLEPAGEIDWRGRLTRMKRAQVVAMDPRLCKPHEREEVLRALLDLACHVPPMDDINSEDIALNHLWVAATLRGGALLEQKLWEPSEEELQLRAQLHAMYGLTRNDVTKPGRVAARARVYDFRRYSYANYFGPFRSDGSWRVDWEQVLAIHHCISVHLVDIPEEAENYRYAIFPLSMPFCQPILDAPVEQLGRDWAGLEGSWQIVFCFMDHHALIAYNGIQHGDDPDGPLDPTLVTEPHFMEAFRAIACELHASAFEPDPLHPNHPRIRLVGTCGQYTLVGQVELTRHGDVRWHFDGGDNGTPVWSCEGVQVGSIRSPYGVLGNWTTVTHDMHDPIGPFWVHKVFEPKTFRTSSADDNTM